jgi:hypothetical protein
MIATNVTQLQYSSSDNLNISMMVIFDTFAGVAIPFTASKNDVEPHGVDLYNRAILGEFGVIAPYINSISAVTILDTSITSKRNDILNARSKNIATCLGTTVDNLTDYEAKLARLWAMGTAILQNPSAYTGFIFNGSALPADALGVTTTINNFMYTQMINFSKIEGIVADTNNLLLQLSRATSIMDVNAIIPK